jgi:hypothetical protein
LSSAILYLAIVAIWALFLVPRWVRRAHSAPLIPEGGVDHESEPDGDTAPADGDESPESALHGVAARFHAVARLGPTLSRRSILRARRRTLATLVVLAAVAAACTAEKLTPWWVCVPPAVMLGMHLLLLREAALADAEQARWRAEETTDAASAARQRARSAHAAPVAAAPTAEIIDISQRVGDQLYDQYADAAARAIGD